EHEGERRDQPFSLFSFFAFFAPSRFRSRDYAFGFLGFRVSLVPLSFLPMRDAPFLSSYHRTSRRALQRFPGQNRVVLYFIG
ncbi:MAG: hypothetical protein M3008_04275, partial [Chloroflexota bacterium]|nr:hypothetical protein [Chloroflexota bacterium]